MSFAMSPEQKMIVYFEPNMSNSTDHSILIESVPVPFSSSPFHITNTMRSILLIDVI